MECDQALRALGGLSDWSFLRRPEAEPKWIRKLQSYCPDVGVEVV